MPNQRTKDDDYRKEPAKKPVAKKPPAKAKPKYVPPRSDPRATAGEGRKPSTTDRARSYQSDPEGNRYVLDEQGGYQRREARQNRQDKRKAVVVTGAGKGGKGNVPLPKPVMYDVPQAEPSYLSSEDQFEYAPVPDFGRGFARGLPQPTRPTNATLASSYYKPEPARGNQERPGATHPPATTGPIVGPPGHVRAVTAPAFGYSDKARGELSRTPINWASLRDPMIAGTYEGNALNINSSVRTPGTSGETAAHEMSHKRWFEDLNAQTPEVAQDYVRDTAALEGSSPAIRGAMENWREITPFYEKYHNNLNAGTDWKIAPTEIHARVAERVTEPGQLPDWYRKKWYPDVWQDEQRGMNQRNRFDQEGNSMYMGPDANGNWGKIDPPRRWR